MQSHFCCQARSPNVCLFEAFSPKCLSVCSVGVFLSFGGSFSSTGKQSVCITTPQHSVSVCMDALRQRRYNTRTHITHITYLSSDTQRLIRNTWFSIYNQYQHFLFKYKPNEEVLLGCFDAHAYACIETRMSLVQCWKRASAALSLKAVYRRWY